MFFCIIGVGDLKELKLCLDTYKTWLSQNMNKQKSSIFSSHNALEEWVMDHGRIVSVNMIPNVIECFRHKLAVQGRNCVSFDVVGEKVQLRLTRWRAKVFP